VAEITTRIVRVIEVPRSQLADFLKMPEAQQVGVYFLMGELSEAGLPRTYIGQSGSVGKRLEQHHQNKDFWNRAFVVISLTNSLTQTHALFLEWPLPKRQKRDASAWRTAMRAHSPTRPRRCKPIATKFTKPPPRCWRRWASPSSNHAQHLVNRLFLKYMHHHKLSKRI